MVEACEQIKSKGDCLKELVGKQNINQELHEFVYLFCMMALFLHIQPAIESGHLKLILVGSSSLNICEALYSASCSLFWKLGGINAGK